MKKIMSRIDRWDTLKKHNTSGHLHHILVLFGIVNSPMFNLVVRSDDYI